MVYFNIISERVDILNDIINKIILLGFSNVLVYLTYNEDIAIVYLLISIILTCIMSSTDKMYIHICLFLLFLFLCTLKPVLLFYLPAIGYDIFTTSLQGSIVLAIIPFATNFSFYHNNYLLLYIFLICIAMILKLQSKKYMTLVQEYNNLRDDTKELELKLEKQNHTLLENQDIEITAAMLSERNRISKEIHDNIGHLLSRSLLQIGALLTISKEETTKETLTALRDSISDGMDSIRNSIHNMHEESIDLTNAISKLVQEFNFCQISYDYDMHTDPDAKVKNAFIAIIKEALNNIMKHSNATNVQVKVLEQPALYQLIISDNGVLTPTTQWKLKHLDFEDGMGLQGMQDRIRLLQGNFNILTEHGCEIFITVPKKGDLPNECISN